MIPYEDDQVTEILIQGAPDWLPIKRGSFTVVNVEFDSPLIEGEKRARTGLTAVDKMDGQEVFFWTDYLVAVKYSTEEGNPTGISPADGRLLP